MSLAATTTLPRHPLLDSPAARTVIRLATPTMAVMFVQSAVAFVETFVVGRLGTEALAGFALVFPVAMLMTMMAGGGMGGGVASAVARALGARRVEDARALAWHSLYISLVFGLAFTGLLLAFGPTLYRALGGGGAVVDYALAYSNVLFAGAIFPWAMFQLSAVFRGAGNTALPGRYMLLSSLVQIPLTWLLVLGVGDWRGLGIAGAGVSWVATSALATALQALALFKGRAGFAPTLADAAPQVRLFGTIMRVGLMSSFNAVLANLTAILITRLAAGFGVAAIAGYGVGARLEFMLVPLSFGIGSALTTMVGVAAGAGEWARARRVAWIGSFIAAGVTGAIGLAAALFPASWIGLFSADPAVIAAGTTYLTRVAPCYVLFGLGMSLNFAAQGAGVIGPPSLASLLRILVAVGGGALAVHVWGLGLDGLFWAVAAAMALYTAVIAGALVLRPWGGRL